MEDRLWGWGSHGPAAVLEKEVLPGVVFKMQTCRRSSPETRSTPSGVQPVNKSHAAREITTITRYIRVRVRIRIYNIIREDGLDMGGGGTVGGSFG